MEKGTCMITYIPVRNEPRPGAEMVTSLIFGESYTILETAGDWLRIKLDFDAYEGWISINSHAEYLEFNTVNDALFLEAAGKHQRLMIPCGGAIPESGTLVADGEKYIIEKKLKTNHHLPLPLRLLKTAQSFMNTPYLWGGRTFMGIDCSGFIQVVFKACGMALPRDTKQQVNSGREVSFEEIMACDLVFFTSPGSEKVSHVGMMIDKNNLIHSSGKVKINRLSPEGLFILEKDRLTYALHSIRRVI
jgi:hypothetical protein